MRRSTVGRESVLGRTCVVGRTFDVERTCSGPYKVRHTDYMLGEGLATNAGPNFMKWYAFCGIIVFVGG